MIPATVTGRSLRAVRLDGWSARSFTVGSSKDLERSHRPMSTSATVQNNARSRPTRAKALELADKAERKRAGRATKAVKLEARTAQARVGRIQKELELQHKQFEGQVSYHFGVRRQTAPLI